MTCTYRHASRYAAGWQHSFPGVLVVCLLSLWLTAASVLAQDNGGLEEKEEDEPVPALDLTAPRTTLALRETVPLTLTGTFDDGSTSNLTAATSGTTYTSSNPGTAMVSPDGLVMGVTVGEATISVFHEGLALSLNFTVVDLADADRDGLPDAYETANGLDPDNPDDALQDLDADHLTNLQEFRNGTEPRVADTDGDGFADGLEVELGTNPLIHTGQLNERCVVSVLNRSSRVDANGDWFLPNIPSNIGQVRMRATCMDQDMTRSGQSEFLTIPRFGAVHVHLGVGPVGINFDHVDPIPATLTVTAPATTLTSVGATVQLTVTATFPDGAQRDVTFASNGTNYTVSNAAVATIDADGLVVAMASGTVLVSAINEGALGVLPLQVVLAGDTDNDGLPDDLEMANGLDPNNPVDALEDADGDGLSNRQELLDFGTDFQVADSDGDGIADGAEIASGADGFVTNPLLADSDGDGLRDPLEIATGSDPTAASSVNLAAALSAITVSPTAFTLAFEQAFGEVPQQLTVTGILRDGTTIDLTSSARGTTYASSDLTICNFGAEDGQVFAGSDGGCTITVSNSGFTATATGTVRTFTPAIATLPIPGYANHVAVADDTLAYVAAGAAGLQVVEVTTTPGAPALQIVGALDTPGNANNIQVVGNMVYIADGPAGLHIINVTDPRQPVVVGGLTTPGEARDVAVANGRAYLAAGAQVHILDITDPSAPQLLSSICTAASARAVAIAENLLIIGEEEPSSMVRIFDVTDPENPPVLSSVDLTLLSPPSTVRELVVHDTLAYVATGGGGIQIIDFSLPTQPQVIGRLSNATVRGFPATRDVALSGRFALFVDAFNTSVALGDVSDPANPTFPVARNVQSSAPIYRLNGIAATSQFVYTTAEVGPRVTTEKDGRSGDTRLVVARYVTLEDTAGMPPTVQLTSPAAGATVLAGSRVLLTATAGDDIAVEAVAFLVAGQVVSRDVRAPYQFSLRIPEVPGPLTLSAQVRDPGGNLGVASDVVVNVVADPGTTVAGRVYNQRGMPVAGATVTCQGVAAITDADGGFMITRVPTTMAALQCVATLSTPYRRWQTAVAGIMPVRGGSTALADIVLTPPVTSLYPGAKFLVGDGPMAVAVADLNADGHVDVMTANNGRRSSFHSFRDTVSSDISLLFGAGNGVFQPEQRLQVGNGPVDVQVADVNQDGTLDLLSLNEGSVSVLLGACQGAYFLREQRFTVTGRAMAVGELNGDTFPDVITINNVNADDIAIFFGNGNGTFQPAQFTAVDQVGVGTAIVVSDLNDDGNNDLAMSNSGGEIAVLLGNGDGTLQTPQLVPAGTLLVAVTSADLNGDTVADLIATNNASGATADTVAVLLGNGDGTFQPAQNFPVGEFPVAVTVGDLNRDGFPDVMTANALGRSRDRGTISVLLGNGDGTLQPEQQLLSGRNPVDVALADVDHDGLIDAVLPSLTTHDVSILLGTGDGSFQLPQRLVTAERPDHLAVADINGDAILDVVTSGRFNFTVHLGVGDGSFEPEQSFPAGSLTGTEIIADINGDARLDLVTINTANALEVFLGNGDGSFQAGQAFPVSAIPAAITSADSDGDGTLDLVAAHACGACPFASVLLGNGDGTFQTPRIVPQDGDIRPVLILAVDVNSDDVPDLIGVDRFLDASDFFPNRDVAVRLGNGDGTFRASQGLTAGDQSIAAVITDANGDGVIDLVVGNVSSDDVSVFFGVGNGSFLPQQRFPVGRGPVAIIADDVNTDGRSDVLTANSTASDVAVLLGTGENRLQAQQRFTVGDEITGIASGDFNGDGLPDLVTVSEGVGPVGGVLSILLHIPEDNARTLPTASITSLTASDAVIAGTIITVAADAADDVAVASVDLLLNGALVSRDRQAPYTFPVTVPSGVDTLTIRLRATDFGGNITESELTVNVIPNLPAILR